MSSKEVVSFVSLTLKSMFPSTICMWWYVLCW